MQQVRLTFQTANYELHGLLAGRIFGGQNRIDGPNTGP